MVPTAGRRGMQAPGGATDDAALEAAVRSIVSRHPSVGFAVGVSRPGRPAWFGSHGLADIGSGTRVTEDTVFRIGSISKVVTAIAVLQLHEGGLVDLDRPASDYLRAFTLLPDGLGWRPATLRHLLTHTAGIPDARGLPDLLAGSLTPDGGRPPILSVAAGRPLPTLAEYYRGGLRVVVEPGTCFAYTNHGFAALGQVVEDVSGQPLERYFRERIFRPLGMTSTDLVRSQRVSAGLATGYAFGRRGPRPVPDRDWIGAGAGGVYSTPRDMARFMAAFLARGANDEGRVLEPGTLATMFEAHYQPDPRIPGMGLGVFRDELAGHLVIGHDGILPGHNAALLVAPEDGVGIFAATNGSAGAFAWLRIELERLVRQLLGLPDERGDPPHRPEVWPELCGRYVLPPRISDPRERLMFGGGAEVFVRGGRLMVRLRTPVPALYRGFALEPADARDPDAFRLDPSQAGLGPIRVVFARDPAGRVNAAHTDLGGQPWSLIRQTAGSPRPAWLGPAVGALALSGAVLMTRRGRRHEMGRQR